jgi:hypothetical protein
MDIAASESANGDNSRRNNMGFFQLAQLARYLAGISSRKRPLFQHTILHGRAHGVFRILFLKSDSSDGILLSFAIDG